jgi:hypothetical protein
MAVDGFLDVCDSRSETCRSGPEVSILLGRRVLIVVIQVV